MNQKKTRKLRKERGIKMDTSRFNLSQDQIELVRAKRAEFEERRKAIKANKIPREKKGWKLIVHRPETA
jgi:hypothetical protein